VQFARAGLTAIGQNIITVFTINRVYRLNSHNARLVPVKFERRKGTHIFYRRDMQVGEKQQRCSAIASTPITPGSTGTPSIW